MDWPELLDHPFFTKIVNEKEYVKQGGDKDKEGDQEEKSTPASLRCVALLLFFLRFQLLQQSASWLYLYFLL